MSSMVHNFPRVEECLKLNYAAVSGRLGIKPARPVFYRPAPPAPNPLPAPPPVLTEKRTSALPALAIVTQTPAPKQPHDDLSVEARIRLAADIANGLAAAFPGISRASQFPAAVAEAFNLSLAAVRGKRRFPELVFARHVGFALAAQLTRLSLPTIGRAFRRDHTTVMHGRDKLAVLVRSALAEGTTPTTDQPGEVL